jgi:ABC-type glycerol-3-phosphate transport system substrate-binding protein
MFNINSTTQAADAAGVFLSFMVSPDPQRIWFETTQQAPVNPSLLADPAIRDAWIDALQWGNPAPLPAQFEAVMLPALDGAVRAVTIEGVDPAVAAAAVLETLAGGAAGSQ